MSEVWKDIEGYEGRYQVSNLGRVRSLDRTETSKRHGEPCDIRYQGKILSPTLGKNGYKRVNFKKNGYQKAYYVHRLVATAFIPNPENLPAVNHKDECRTNNQADNLEWCTFEYNNNYGGHTSRMADKNKKYQVAMFTMDGQLERTFPSLVDAARFIGDAKYDGGIGDACRGIKLSSKGHRWSFIIDGVIQPLKPLRTEEQRAESNRLKSQNSAESRPILQLDKAGNQIARFESAAAAARALGIQSANIRKCARNERPYAGGYRWKYLE